MTPDRIADIRAGMDSLERTNTGGMVDGDAWIRLVRECLDAIESANNEIQSLCEEKAGEDL